MPKDTKSSGYNKAPACESRGFGYKKEGENFDTPSMKLLSHTYRLLYCWNTFVKRIMASFTGQSFLSVLTIAFS